MTTTETNTKSRTVKIIKLDPIFKSVTVKVWDSSLKNSIDEYPEVNVDLSRLDLDGDILEQLSELLVGQLEYQKSMESSISQTYIDKINKLIGTVTDVPEKIEEEVFDHDEPSFITAQENFKLEWESLNNQDNVGVATHDL